MSGFDSLAALLTEPAADERPNLYDGIGGAPGIKGPPGPDDIASDWSWPSFAAGALCGLVAGVVLIGVPAIILAAILR